MSSSSPLVRVVIAGMVISTVLFLLLAYAFSASASELAGTSVGKTAGEITASLTAQGYEVRKLEREHGMLEAYALKDGKRYEIYVDPASGTVAKVTEED